MKYKRFLPNLNNKGYSLIELLVAVTLGMIICGMSLSAILANRKLYQYDLVRTRINQNLRSAMDLVGVNIREAGENLSASFPAVELINGINGGPDELILRRSLVDEVLKLCLPISHGASITDIYFAYPTTEPGCTYTDQQHNYDVWRQYRLDYEANQATEIQPSPAVMIYDPTQLIGEFFDYESEASAGSNMYIIRPPGTFLHSYTVGQTALFLMEEWRFRIDTDLNFEPVLQVIQNGNAANPLNVSYNISDFQVSIILSDKTEVNSFAASDNWTNIRAIKVTLIGEETSLGNKVKREYTSTFFPRNILSH